METWAYKVVKPKTDIEKNWNPELEDWLGYILYDRDLDMNPFISPDEEWWVIKTEDYDAADVFSMPLLIHTSCMEKIRLCSCPYHQVVWWCGCTCGGY